jgi:hypothetical protein
MPWRKLGFATTKDLYPEDVKQKAPRLFVIDAAFEVLFEVMRGETNYDEEGQKASSR